MILKVSVIRNRNTVEKDWLWVGMKFDTDRKVGLLCPGFEITAFQFVLFYSINEVVKNN